jgi:hypothetical protein
MDGFRYDILLANDPWKNYEIGPLISPTGEWNGSTFAIGAEAYAALPTGSYPIVIRAFEQTGSFYDFFGGVLYR